MLRVAYPGKRRTTESVALYDINADPGQAMNIADQHPQEVQRMLADLVAWQQSVKESFAGKDYVR
jgi:hypothetical protein